MKIRVKTNLLSLCLATCLLLCSCGTPVVTEDEVGNIVVVEAGPVSMEDTAVIDYALPKQNPNVLVSRGGYGVENDKVFHVKGEQLPNSFSLVNAETRRVVYTGIIKDVHYHEDHGVYVGHGDFSGVKTPGTYYVECEGLGRSYEFTLEEQMYTRLFKEAMAEVLKDCHEQNADLDEVYALMNVYEWYPELFEDTDNDGTPDVLKELAAWIQSVDETAKENNTEMLYAAILAKFSYLYQKYDKKYATECVKRSNAVYESLLTTIQDNANTFLALTELFRATGKSSYNTAIVEYGTYMSKNSTYLEQKGYLYGVMNYLSTRQAVDRTLCGDMMSDLMDRAEEVGNSYEDMVEPYGERNGGVDDVLTKALEICGANRVLNSYQYYNEVMTLLHYLCGANIEAVSFYPDSERMDSYLMLFGQLAYNELGLDSNSRVG